VYTYSFTTQILITQQCYNIIFQCRAKHTNVQSYDVCVIIKYESILIMDLVEKHGMVVRRFAKQGWAIDMHYSIET
jgi:hypothetical protein